MFYYSKKSSKKILHSEECGHIQRTQLSDMGYFGSLDEAYEKGYRLCRHCSKLDRAFRKENDDIVKLSMKYALRIFRHKKFIGVESKDGLWKIVLSDIGHKFELYHQNTYEKKTDSESRISGYHLQNISKGTIHGFLQYIGEHDDYRSVHPIEIKPPKKQKAPPLKGTKRYRKQQNKIARYERKRSIARVLDLIDNLNVGVSA